MGETSGITMGIKEPRQKLRRVLTALHTLPCLSKARRRPGKKKIIAFEDLAISMLRYLDNCNEVKVGITEFQERMEVPEQKRYFHSASGAAGHE